MSRGWLATDDDDEEEEDGSAQIASTAPVERHILLHRLHDPVLRPHWYLWTVDGDLRYSIDDPRLDLYFSYLPTYEDAWLEECTRIVSSPQPNDECPICLDSFLDQPCIATTLCNHLYHFVCLKQWFVNSRDNGEVQVRCCMCRRLLLDIDELEDLEIAKRKGVPIHLTAEQYSASTQRGGMSIDELFKK